MTAMRAKPKSQGCVSEETLEKGGHGVEMAVNKAYGESAHPLWFVNPPTQKAHTIIGPSVGVRAIVSARRRGLKKMLGCHGDRGLGEGLRGRIG